MDGIRAQEMNLRQPDFPSSLAIPQLTKPHEKTSCDCRGARENELVFDSTNLGWASAEACAKIGLAKFDKERQIRRFYEWRFAAECGLKSSQG